MADHTTLLIIGAGPFGLAMGAQAKHENLDYLVVGYPLSLWKSNMPKGMYLRSGCDWHLDPQEVYTIESYVRTKNLTPEEVEPLSRDFYLDYAEWFQEQTQVQVRKTLVQRLEHIDSGKGLFQATLEDGQTLTAENVLIALGFQYFKNIPAELASLLPAGRFSHTCDFVDFESLKGKRCLIIGGRQSAFEWAVLIQEQGATAVHVCHRHDSPTHTVSEWSWVNSLLDGMVDDPGWFRRLSSQEREEINQRFWQEGRLKVEPWLEKRMNRDIVKLWSNLKVVECNVLSSGELEVKLDIGETLLVDHIVLATGYKVDVERIPFLDRQTVLAKLEKRNGFPVLDERFQSNIPGLFFTSMPATQDFGLFFAFTVSVRASAKIIGSAIKARERDSRRVQAKG